MQSPGPLFSTSTEGLTGHHCPRPQAASSPRKRGTAMSGEQQLERSVLEAKERDELYTIAEALSLKPASRTKKADLVDQILKATGVDVTPADGETAEKPKRTRTTRARAAASEVSDNGDGDVAADAVPSGNGSSAEATAAEREAPALELAFDASAAP